MKIITQTLFKNDREYIRKHNDNLFPGMIFYRSINGYNTNETIDKLKKSNLKYKNLDFPNYGTLANFLTKVEILYNEVNKGTDYFCLIEDDLKLKKDFMQFIDNNAKLADKYNIVRLNTWGEGYIFSNKGASNVLKLINESGIIKNIDNQLRENCGSEIHLQNTPWTLEVETNNGDCNKTQKINLSLL